MCTNTEIESFTWKPLLANVNDTCSQCLYKFSILVNLSFIVFIFHFYCTDTNALNVAQQILIETMLRQQQIYEQCSNNWMYVQVWNFMK